MASGPLKSELRPERLMAALTRAQVPTGSAKVAIKTDRKTKKAVKTIADMVKRMAAVRRMTMYLAAQATALGVAARIPKSPEWSEYQSSVKLMRASAEKALYPTFVAYAKPRPLKNRDIDSARSVMYVRAKKTLLGRVPEEVLVLAKYSPWTTETIPFSPKKNQAIIVVRKARKKEVQRITAQRLRDAPQWRAELEKAGIRQVRKTNKPPELKTQLISDLAFDALRLEFGYGGTRPVPHWRPAIHEALLYVKRLYKQRSFLSKAMTEASFQAWRKWPPKVGSSIRHDELKGLRKFSKRLHVRV